MNTYLGNAFSLGMMDCVGLGSRVNVEIRHLTLAEVVWILGQGEWTSCVGHQDTANLFSELLGVPVAMNRISTSLAIGDSLIVGQYNGPRLPEGATSLPEGATIRWFSLSVGK